MAVSLSESTLSLLVNEKATLTAQANPWTLSDRSVTWSSSDDSVVTVKDGVVTGVGEGSAVITAASAVDPEVKAECYVTVTTLHITVEGALQDKDKQHIKQAAPEKGGRLCLPPAPQPDGGGNGQPSAQNTGQAGAEQNKCGYGHEATS